MLSMRMTFKDVSLYVRSIHKTKTSNIFRFVSVHLRSKKIKKYILLALCSIKSQKKVILLYILKTALSSYLSCSKAPYYIYVALGKIY